MLSVKKPESILVAEDDLEVRNYLDLYLRCRGYSVKHAENGSEVISQLRRGGARGISLVLLDIMMPSQDGIETLREIRRVDKDLPVIMLSGSSSPTTVVEAMKCGANDFLEKPVVGEQLVDAIRRTLGSAPAPQEGSKNGWRELAAARNLGGGQSWIQKMDTLLSRVGASDAPVLLNGETGSGKEVLARMLHAASGRASQPFLKLNCAALPSELVESELFGYEKGAFTGAFKSKPGKFDLADGGTLLLDEIGDMDIRLQAKLLHVLQDQEFERLGGSETVHVDVRIMAATHTDLEKAIREGRFREDLYYRLNVINIHVPPLRERKEEIPTLVECFLKKFATPGTASPDITPALQEALTAYHWPGNVRELENFIRRYMVLRDPDGAIEELDRKARQSFSKVSVAVEAENSLEAPLSDADGLMAPLEKVTEAQKRAEAETILAALNRCRWNRKQAAVALHVDYKALLYKMKKLGIDRNPVEAAAAC